MDKKVMKIEMNRPKVWPIDPLPFLNICIFFIIVTSTTNHIVSICKTHTHFKLLFAPFSFCFGGIYYHTVSIYNIMHLETYHWLLCKFDVLNSESNILWSLQRSWRRPNLVSMTFLCYETALKARSNLISNLII